MRSTQTITRQVTSNKTTLANAIKLAGFAVAIAISANAALAEAPLPNTKTTYIDHTVKTSSWGLAFDNDILVPGKRDQDYTYGANVHVAGAKATEHWLSLHRPLNTLNKALNIKRPNVTTTVHKIEYGLFGFTPEDINQAQPTKDDRPYASLIYVSSSTETYDYARDVSWNSSLTIGLLGLNLVGKLQEHVHEATDGDKPQGWSHQISDGGEPTLRYTLARQSLLYQDTQGFEIKHSTQASLGYITEASWSISARYGDIHTSWASFNPELVNYGEQSAQTTKTKLSEHYFWAGLALKARAYNAFLQGQFRDSDVEYSHDEIHHGILEAWLGYTVAFENGIRLTYTLRGHTSELKDGIGDRHVVWGGINVAKTFRS